MKNIDSFMEFIKAHKEIVAFMSSRVHHYEFIVVEIDGKSVLSSPATFLEDWEGLFKRVKSYRDKGHSVRVLKGKWEKGNNSLL